MVFKMSLKTVSKMGANVGRSLSKRRFWFEDSGNNPATPSPATPNAPQTPSAPSANSDIPEWVSDPTRAYAEIQRLRAENAQSRTQRQAVVQQTTQQLEQAGQYEQLYRQQQSRLQELEAQARLGETVLEATRTRNAARVAGLPEDARELVPPLDDPLALQAWLDRAETRLVRRPAPNTDAGASGQASAPKALTAEQLVLARQMNISPEKFQAQLERQQNIQR